MNYTAPLTDMRFLLEQVTGLDTISQLPGCEDATATTVGAARFSANLAAELLRRRLRVTFRDLFYKLSGRHRS